MAKFGKSSLIKLSKLHPDLQEILIEAIKIMDFTILCTVRGKIRQNIAYAEGHSKLKFPQSKHNKDPSDAFDVAPWHAKRPHIRWNDLESFNRLCDIIEGIALMKGIKIRMGRDFSFKDYPHVERVA